MNWEVAGNTLCLVSFVIYPVGPCDFSCRLASCSTLNALALLCVTSLLSLHLQETLEYFANPDNLNSDVLPPGLATWDPAPYLASAVPIAASVVGVNFIHEVGHRIAAFIRKVKLGPTYFVPNLQVRAAAVVPGRQRHTRCCQHTGNIRMAVVVQSKAGNHHCGVLIGG